MRRGRASPFSSEGLGAGMVLLVSICKEPGMHKIVPMPLGFNSTGHQLGFIPARTHV